MSKQISIDKINHRVSQALTILGIVKEQLSENELQTIYWKLSCAVDPNNDELEFRTEQLLGAEKILRIAVNKVRLRNNV